VTLDGVVFNSGVSGIVNDGAMKGYIILGPGQSAAVESDGSNYWSVNKPNRIRIPLAGSIFYQSELSGDDGNDGLTSSTPKYSLQQVHNFLMENVDFALNTVTVSLLSSVSASGPMAGRGRMLGQVQASSLAFDGGGTAVVSAVGGFSADDGSMFSVGNMTLSGAGIQAQHFGSLIVVLAGMKFGAVIGSIQISADFGAGVIIAGSYTINGGAGSHFAAQYGGAIGVLGSNTITLTGTPAFSSQFADADRLGVLQAAGLTFSGSATGTRYLANVNGLIDTGGGGANYFPGNAAGSAVNGGYYL
jgi:hypothetical protein